MSSSAFYGNVLENLGYKFTGKKVLKHYKPIRIFKKKTQTTNIGHMTKYFKKYVRKFGFEILSKKHREQLKKAKFIFNPKTKRFSKWGGTYATKSGRIRKKFKKKGFIVKDNIYVKYCDNIHVMIIMISNIVIIMM